MHDQYPQLWNAGPVRIKGKSGPRAKPKPPKVRRKCRRPDCENDVREGHGAVQYCDEHILVS